MRIIDRTKHVVVLLVEDSDAHRKEISNRLERLHAVVLGAKTHGAARELIGQHWNEIDAVILDACVEPPYLTYDAPALLEDLVRLNAQRGEERAVILGLSSDKHTRLRLMRHGCTGACSKDRALLDFLPEFLSDIHEQHLMSQTFKKPAPD